ncbi:MAG: amidohydrolase family protein [Chloroflexi bacterium]|nr:amidohydrolase family protein [Chloroflexota bacterium]
MPGMMDLHIHLSNGVTDPRDPHILYGMLFSTTQMLTLWSARNARLHLEAGFTTVRDFASFVSDGRNPEVLAVRDAISLGLEPGPRVFAGGWVSTTAGHRDMFPPRTWPRQPGSLADGPWEIRRAVREMARDGVDFIKTSTSGGAGGHTEEIWWRSLTTEELEALVDESHAFGFKVATHSHTPESVKAALRAGADTIEHGIYLDDEAIALLVERQALLVPTLSARSERAVAHRRKAGSPPEVIRKFESAQASGYDSFRRAHEAGVMIAMGTDTGRGLREYHGKNAYELGLMVQGGLSPMEAIVAATRNGAIGLGQQESLGTLEPGKLADLLVVAGDPLTDVTLLEEAANIRVVVKGGAIVVDRRDKSGAG